MQRQHAACQVLKTPNGCSSANTHTDNKWNMGKVAIISVKTNDSEDVPFIFYYSHCSGQR